MSGAANGALLALGDLRVDFHTAGGDVRAVGVEVDAQVAERQ